MLNQGIGRARPCCGSSRKINSGNKIENLKTGDVYKRQGYTYHKNCDSIQEHNSAIALLELQKKQCDEQILALKRPRGMKLGLLIFALFTFCCIIAPLVASPFATESYNDFVIAKAIFLGLFGIGLISVFGYLIYLLQWHQDR